MSVEEKADKAEKEEQFPPELKDCAGHLMQHPLTCKEHDPEIFRLILRHEATLDKLFTQRLGYRLHVTADTARLYKNGYVPLRRKLSAKKIARPFMQQEYVLLALVLGATVAGPGIISLKDLVARVRSLAVETEIVLDDSIGTRRAMVTALEWMVEHGLAQELHQKIEAYVGDGDADAVLKFRPDRIAMLPLPSLGREESSEPRRVTRQWMRCWLAEEPVLYRTDLTPEEWTELRRRLGEEERFLEEMFGLDLEVRAEGVAAIDETGRLTDTLFPSAGTLHHAALLLIEKLYDSPNHSQTEEEMTETLICLGQLHQNRWRDDALKHPQTLCRRVTELLRDLRLAEWVQEAERAPVLRLLPAAGRFLPGLQAQSGQ